MTNQHLNYCIPLILCIFIFCQVSSSLKQNEILKYRNEVKQMFYHAYDGYMRHAYPYDELRPLTCDGHDTWGSYSLTLIDALDTLAIMGNSSEFNRVVDVISQRKDFNEDINVSVFETNIRIVGGLLSGHLLYQKMNVPLPKGWPCDGPLLRLAKDAAYRLLPAFDTTTGMPYGTVNLRHGVPEGETPVTCTAGVGTFIIEFGTISRLTNDPIFEQVALRALNKLWSLRSSIDLVGNHIDVQTGQWTAQDSGIGAGVDSFFEYMVKGSFYLQRPELLQMFKEARKPIEKYLRHEDWYLWAAMQKGQVTMAVFQSLEAFWPGILTLVGDVEDAKKIILNYQQVWKQFGFTPEFYNIAQSFAQSRREGYPLRPELVESLVYLYQATGDELYLKMGANVITSIEHSAKTSCGYATIKNVNDHSLANRMESFFLAETTKYLYILFTEDHWIHNTGSRGYIHSIGKRKCILGASYFFNTEAHPMDTGAIGCCMSPTYLSAFKTPSQSFGIKNTKPKAQQPLNTFGKLKDKILQLKSSYEDTMVNLTLPKEKISAPENQNLLQDEGNLSVGVLYKPKKEEREEAIDDPKEIKTADASGSLGVINYVIKSNSPSEDSSSHRTEARIVEVKPEPPKLDPKPEKKEFSMDELKKRVKKDMVSYKEDWGDVPYSVLHCPYIPYTFFLSNKGQVFR